MDLVIDWRNMKKLKFSILKYFALCSFGISIAQGFVDLIFDQLILPRYMKNGINTSEGVVVAIIMLAWLLISLSVFFMGAYLFYRLIKKATEAESKRQVQEQNLLYSCIAHDLKTPITSVQGFAAALKDGKIKPEEQAEILDIIYRKSHHMNELIDTLSTYSKLGTESYQLTFKSSNLCTIVRDLVAENYSELEEKKMELNIEIPEEPIFCQLDEREFRRAVNNLIVNACKHNAKGTDILIKVQEENGKAFVMVADGGEKIPKELAETMFHPFVSGNASRTSGKGSGLGLAISAAIVGKHGGKLYVENEVKGYTKGFVIQMKVEEEKVKTMSR